MYHSHTARHLRWEASPRSSGCREVVAKYRLAFEVLSSLEVYGEAFYCAYYLRHNTTGNLIIGANTKGWAMQQNCNDDWLSNTELMYIETHR
jgi:hypothetical protein